MSQNQVSTLKRGLLVLEFIKQRREITLAEVMKEFQLSKSTAFRLLTTLEDMNYIYKILTQYFFNPKNFIEIAERRSIRDWASLQSIHQAAQHLQMSTYLGKVILAYFDEGKIASIMNKMSMEPATKNTFQDPKLFRYHLKAIQDDGYAFDDEELTNGIAV